MILIPYDVYLVTWPDNQSISSTLSAWTNMKSQYGSKLAKERERFLIAEQQLIGSSDEDIIKGSMETICESCQKWLLENVGIESYYYGDTAYLEKIDGIAMCEGSSKDMETCKSAYIFIIDLGLSKQAAQSVSNSVNIDNKYIMEAV